MPLEQDLEKRRELIDQLTKLDEKIETEYPDTLRDEFAGIRVLKVSALYRFLVEWGLSRGANLIYIKGGGKAPAVILTDNIALIRKSQLLLDSPAAPAVPVEAEVPAVPEIEEAPELDAEDEDDEDDR